MSIIGNYTDITIPIEKSLIGIYAKKCNHNLTESEFGYILIDNNTGKRYDFDKVTMRYPEDIRLQISENHDKQEMKDYLSLTIIKEEN